MTKAELIASLPSQITYDMIEEAYGASTLIASFEEQLEDCENTLNLISCFRWSFTRQKHEFWKAVYEYAKRQYTLGPLA